jgi:D-cysteine desulfhydrase
MMAVNFPPSLGFTHAPTPVIELKRNTAYRLWVKRDDLTGIELSGNKIRKLDFLFQQALQEGADGIITCGGLQSNHCRAAAYLCRKVGLKCLLYLRGEPGQKPAGNYFLNLLSGAEIKYVDRAAYEQIDTRMTQEAARQSKQGTKYYIIPEGGSNEIGAWGYCRCFFELTGQMEDLGQPPDAVVVASGSGGTHAGLLIGKLMADSSVDIISVNVCDDALYFQKKIARIIHAFEVRYQYRWDLNESDIHIIDGFVGPGYAEIDERVVKVIKRVILETGLILDPVYTAKAFLGLENALQMHKLKYKNIVFIHTGGVFGLFPYYKHFI